MNLPRRSWPQMQLCQPIHPQKHTMCNILTESSFSIKNGMKSNCHEFSGVYFLWHFQHTCKSFCPLLVLTTFGGRGESLMPWARWRLMAAKMLLGCQKESYLPSTPPGKGGTWTTAGGIVRRTCCRSDRHHRNVREAENASEGVQILMKKFPLWAFREISMCIFLFSRDTGTAFGGLCKHLNKTEAPKSFRNCLQSPPSER